MGGEGYGFASGPRFEDVDVDVEIWEGGEGMEEGGADCAGVGEGEDADCCISCVIRVGGRLRRCMFVEPSHEMVVKLFSNPLPLQHHILEYIGSNASKMRSAIRPFTKFFVPTFRHKFEGSKQTRFDCRGHTGACGAELFCGLDDHLMQLMRTCCKA